MRKSILFLYVIIGLIVIDRAISFSILEDALVEPNNSPHVGSDLIITCTTSSAHLHCIWKHNDEVCKFDWDRRHRNVLKPNCDAFGKRLTFHGIYPAHECKMKLSNVTLLDSGTWTCEMDNDRKRIHQDITIEVIQRPLHPQNETRNKTGLNNSMLSKRTMSDDQTKTPSSIQTTKSTVRNSESASSLKTNITEFTIKQESKSANKSYAWYKFHRVKNL